MKYAITGMAGMFPNARNLDEYWTNIVQAAMSPASSLERHWGLRREQYKNPHDDNKSWIYNDHGYCLPEGEVEGSLNASGRQVAAARTMLRSLASQINSVSPGFDYSRTGLILGTSWTDVDYFNKDIELLQGKPLHEMKEPVITPDKQVSDIAGSIGIGGPSYAVDTACASSLYALDNGIGLLNSGLADSVIVMGLNISIPYYLYVGFSKLRALASDRYLLPFSKDASGILLGEGGGAILVEPLDQAEKAGRPVLAVIKSLGLSADGEERSPFAPGYQGQLSALTKAYDGLKGSTIHYVEAHGTATKIGDETELTALHDFFHSFQPGKRVPIGSVKSLIGHGLAAAGIASIIKAVLMINKGIIPPHIAVTPHELLESSCLYLPGEAEKLGHGGEEVNIGVSSFGFGGANSHAVISSYRRSESQSTEARHIAAGTARIPGVLLQEPIAIVDCGSDRERRTPSPQPDGSFGTIPFPVERFQFIDRLSGWADQPVTGDFFLDQYTIDADGLKMGPNSLKKMDPFLAVTLHTLNVMLSRHEDIKSSQETAVVLGSNMSGTMSLRQFRKCYFLFHSHERQGMSEDVGQFAERDISFEEITSTIPAMLSGYPARSFNFQGFHQTLSGGTSTFLSMLLMAPYWLNSRCSHLVIGAGHMVKSPSDIAAFRQQYGQLPSVREGISTFILQKLSNARSKKRSILGYIPAIVPGTVASTFEAACLAANIDPDAVGHTETCQLKLASNYWGEAAGTEELLRLIQADSKLSCLQFMDEDKLAATIFYVKEQDRAGHNRPIRIPAEIKFNGPAKVNAIRTGTEEEANEAPVLASSSGSAWSLESASLIHDHIALLARTYFEHQRKLVQVFSTPRNRSAASPLGIQENNVERLFRAMYVNPRNIVIDNIRYDQAGLLCEGRLVVDQAHPYFFDHPLDHVPGFLIMEGMLQLVKIHAMHTMSLANADDYYVHGLKVKFDRYCELDAPAHIRTTLASRSLNERMELTCEVIQNGSRICTAAIGITRIRSIQAGEQRVIRPAALAKQKEVHKTNQSNIVVEGLEIDPATERAACVSILPADDHVLLDGGGRAASALYLLEVTRQFLSQISHTFGVPFDMQRILLSIDIQVHQALDKRSAVSIASEKQNAIQLNDTYLSNLKTTLTCQSQVIAVTMYQSQAVKAEVYDKLRWKHAK